VELVDRINALIPEIEPMHSISQEFIELVEILGVPEEWEVNEPTAKTAIEYLTKKRDELNGK